MEKPLTANGKPLTILITGANGQLGVTLQDVLKEHDLILTDRDELDITDEQNCLEFIVEQKPDAIINAAAYTAVDQAETEIELARKINADGPRNLALAAKNIGALFFHVSTDFVFDGKGGGQDLGLRTLDSGNSIPHAEGLGLRTQELENSLKPKTKDQSPVPYTELDTPHPLSVYGLTKFEGEEAVKEVGGKYFILRTAWLYSPYGKNFVKTFIKLGREKDELKVVDDQIGCPTYAYDLANAIKQLIVSSQQSADIDSQQPTANRKPEYGLYHFAGSGQASWCDFAKEIVAMSGGTAKILPTTALEYDLPAKRPAYGVLDCSKIESLGIKTRPWKESLKECIDKLKVEGL